VGVELIALEQWKQWEKQYTILPYVRSLRLEQGDVLPLFWERVWKEASEYACLLESGNGGRYTIVGLRPVSVIEGKEGQSRVLEPSELDGQWTENSAQAAVAGTPIGQLRSWLAPWTSPRVERTTEEWPDCLGGVLGYWSYDVVRSLEKLPKLAQDDLKLPDYVFVRFEELWILDQRERIVYCSVHSPVAGTDSIEHKYRSAQQRAEEMERQWLGWLSDGYSEQAIARSQSMRDAMGKDRLQIDVESLPNVTTSMSKAEYQEAVRRIQRYIGQGDVFQVNLALRQSRRTKVSPEMLYEWLRVVNPSPYMGLLRTPDFALVSASPELLVKLDDGRLSTRPIAGTRRRGATPEEDRAMEDELLGNEKERAEHVMLVDLERNDLGRVAAYGSVRVPELMTVERYSHVMHLVSQVEARLAPGKDALDVMAAVFPGGTITGAPKIRTMEIIEELEPTRRGPYTGSMGWIDYNGNMEFNIIIRTIAVQDGICHIQAGAGIVIDSVPEREFHECLNKAKALWKAVQYSEEQEERA
jgi:para-aminobenzoate synthetase component I